MYSYDLPTSTYLYPYRWREKREEKVVARREKPSTTLKRLDKDKTQRECERRQQEEITTLHVQEVKRSLVADQLQRECYRRHEDDQKVLHAHKTKKAIVTKQNEKLQKLQDSDMDRRLEEEKVERIRNLTRASKPSQGESFFIPSKDEPPKGKPEWISLF